MIFFKKKMNEQLFNETKKNDLYSYTYIILYHITFKKIIKYKTSKLLILPKSKFNTFLVRIIIFIVLIILFKFFFQSF